MCSAATAPALVLASIGAGSHGEFVPHVSVTVPEANDRADVQRSYEAVLIVESRLTASGRNV